MAITLDGSTGITYPAGGLGNTAGAAVGTTDTQTLTNKTLTSPTITGATISGGQVQGGALTAMTAASTSGTSIDFTSIPSWVKRITVMFSGVSTSGATDVLVQIGAGSITSTGYVSGSVRVANANSTARTTSTAGYNLSTSSGATTFQGILTIANITGNTWVSSHSINNDGGSVGIFGGGTLSLSGTLDRVRITTVNGTDAFDAGNINIFYE